MRIGQGFDVHAFAEGRELTLGGVKIPYAKGMAAHSDGDVLLHALTDALLGAAGLGDIGRHFPDTSPQYENIDSRILLRHAMDLIKQAGYRVGNADLTLIAQKPKMAPYLAAMIQNIAKDLELDTGDVNVKATTTKHLGFTGREEGIAAMAVVLLMDSGSAD